jgi:hypothetical protein
MPPAQRAVPLRDENAFFGEIENLKARLDGDRRSGNICTRVMWMRE